jgi:hypothetical protein
MSDHPDGAAAAISYRLLAGQPARSENGGRAMTWITVAIPPFASVEQFDKVVADQRTAPDGMEARYFGTADDGTLRFVTVWESKDHADRFFATTLGPALARSLGPEPSGAPQVTGIDVARTYVRQPDA